MLTEFFRERKAQSRAKHDILRRYAPKWSGIILNGLERRYAQGKLRRGFVAQLAYIDGFAGAGRYERDADKEPPAPGEEPVWGSPIIALREIEAQASRYRARFPVVVSAVLADENTLNYDELLASLAGTNLSLSVRPVGGFSQLEQSGIAVLNRDFRDIVRDAADWIDDRAFVLAFIDPFGPAMDLDSMSVLLRRQQTDTIALFPYQDLAIRGGSSRKPEEEWEPNDRANITRFDAHFGTREWRDIYADVRLTAPERERAFVELYLRQLSSVDPAAIVKRIGLRSSSMADRTAYYLCMTSRDASGALEFNALIRETARMERLEIWRDQESWLRQREAAGGQANLFETESMIETPAALPVISANIEEVKGDLLTACGDGVQRTYKQVQLVMARSIYTVSEIESALRALRKHVISREHSPGVLTKIPDLRG